MNTWLPCLQDGSGSVAEKIREYDQKILEVCGWKEGMLRLYFSIASATADVNDVRGSYCKQ